MEPHHVCGGHDPGRALIRGVGARWAPSAFGHRQPFAVGKPVVSCRGAIQAFDAAERPGIAAYVPSLFVGAHPHPRRHSPLPESDPAANPARHLPGPVNVAHTVRRALAS